MKTVVLTASMMMIFISLSLAQPIILNNENGEEVHLYKSSHALIVGVSNYTNGWPSLRGVMKDMAAVKDALEEQGFHVITVIDPNFEELGNAFSSFISKYGMDPDSRLIFYFAGHGHTVKTSYGEEMGYIIPSDAPNPNIDRNGFLAGSLAMQQIEVYAKQIQSKHALFLFDACFSGSIFAISRAVPENISYKTAKPVRQFITSGSADETVPDESVFRQQFISALKGEADVNRDGFVTGTELGEFLQEKVVNYSRGSQHPQYGKIRNPHLDKGDFVFLSFAEDSKALTAASMKEQETFERSLARETAETPTAQAAKSKSLTVYTPVTNENFIQSFGEMREIFGNIALVSVKGKVVSADNAGGGKVEAVRDKIEAWETFSIEIIKDNKIALKTAKGYYLGLNQDNQTIEATYKKRDINCVFEIVELEDDLVALRAFNGKFVLAEGGGGQGLKVVSDKVNKHELFKLVRVNSFGILTNNRQYLSVIDNTIKANKNKFADNELFHFVKFDNNKVGLKTNSGAYVKIDSEGSYIVKDNPGFESVFYIEFLSDNTFRLRTLSGKYVTAVGGGGFMLRARTETAGDWETFKLEPRCKLNK